MVGGGYHVDASIGCVVKHEEELVYLSVLIVVVIIASLRNHAVELIEEKQGGGLLLGFLEKIANLGLCSVYIRGSKVVGDHFHKVYTDFLCHLFRDKGLSHTCGSIEKQIGSSEKLHFYSRYLRILGQRIYIFCTFTG